MRKLATLTPFLLLLSVTTCKEGRDPAKVADRVLVGSVWTMDPQRPRAEAVAIQNRRIAYVGSAAEVQAWIGSATEVIDARGGMILPGFQDAHVHVLEGGVAMGDCDLSAAADAEAALAQVAGCAATQDRGWLRGGGYQLTHFADGNAKAAALDELVPERPVFLTSSDGHSAWVNSMALELAGIDVGTPDPPAGRIERDAITGEPTGTLRETAMGLVERLLPARTPQERVEGLQRGLDIVRRLGITAFQEAAIDAEGLEAYAQLAERGELTARVSISLEVDPDRGTEQVAELVALRERYQRGLLRVGTAKLFVDGVIEAQTAALLQPYVGMGDFAGYLEFAEDRLDEMVVALDREDFQIHAHAIGDRAIRVALDAIEKARQRNGERDARHHLAHIQLWHPDDIPRMRRLEVIANFQPLWAWADDFITDLSEPYLGPERSRWLYPIRSLVDSGAVVVFGSDWDVSTMNPLPAIEVGMTRQDPADSASPVWLPQERVDLETMLAGYTINAARVNFLETESGSIEVGKRADLVVLERDLSTIPASEIGDVEVLLTLFDGEVVFRSSPRARAD